MWSGMDAETFRAWRRRQGLTQDEAARQLGLKRRMIQYYERGERGGRHVAIPKHVPAGRSARASAISTDARRAASRSPSDRLKKAAGLPNKAAV